MTVLGVHGIFNRKYFEETGSVESAQQRMGDEWTALLTRGRRKHKPQLPAPSQVKIAYYSDLLVPSVIPMAAGLYEELTDEALLVFQAIADEMAQAEGVSPESALVPQNLAHRVLVQNPLEFVRKRLGDRGVAVVGRFSEEIALYFAADRGRRLAVRERIAERIRDERPTVILAHSLGSVAVYETLCGDPGLGVGVELLVTLGSPLAVPKIIFERLDPTPAAQGIRPPAIGRWINIADVGDPVAVPPGAVMTRFEGLDKHISVSLHKANPHGVGGYLRCRGLAEVLADYEL